MMLLLLCTATTMWSNTTNAQDLATDSLALVDLYNDCGGSDWVGFDTWLNGPIATWEKVTVDSAMQRVTNVEFKDMTLTGTLPSSLGNLDEMSGKIEFRDDKGLTGALPAFLWNWTKVDRFQIKFSGYTSIDTTGMSNMVNLTEFNTEGTPIGGMIPGVIFTLPAIEKLYFHDSEFAQVPPELLTTTGLTRLYLNGDNLTDLPDMSGMTWGSGAKVRVQDNALTFEDLEANVALSSDPNVGEFKYSPQAMIGTEQYLYIPDGYNITIDPNVGGTANSYTWLKDGTPTTTTTPTYDIPSFDAAIHSGTYVAVIQNTLVPGLDITTADLHLFASAFAQDSLALVDLYNDCGGTTWSGFSTWLNGPLKDWEEVTVDSATQRVTHVGFKNMDLSGTLPTSLGNMTKMGGKIEFHDDSLLTGELPAFLWRWVDVDRFQLKRTGITSVNTEGMENMVNLTEYNTEANPITGEIPGVVFTLPSIVKVYVHDCEYDQVPSELTMATRLDRLYFNGNNLVDVPDMSGMTWGDGAKIRLQDNALTFEDLESNVAIANDSAVAELNFSPQAKVGMASVLDLATGDTLSLSIAVGGSANQYSWIKDSAQVGGDMLYEVTSVTVSDVGDYYLLVQSPLVLGLDITSETYQVNVDGITGIEDLSYFGDIKVLGNPVASNLRIEAAQIIEQVKILDLTGKQVSLETVRNRSIDVPVGQLTPGIYFVVLRSGNFAHTLKVVKR